MAQRSHVPKFGNWESGDNVPYTVYFDKARKGRGAGKMINPNDPQDNPDLLSDTSSPARPPPTGPKHESHNRQPSREDSSDLKEFVDSPARHDGPRQGGRGVGPGEGRRPRQTSVGSEHSVERSPLHPQYQAKVGGRGVGAPSPLWDGKGGSTEASHGTPGRSRARPAARGDETPERGAAVPKFGEWDESNPASADGFTHIFNKVREERHTGANAMGTAPSYPTAGKPKPNTQPKGCCFFFGKK